MIIKNAKNIEHDKMRWVILLLAGAVILPTICLLWFMTQTVKNERLAVRQTLINSYSKDLEKIAKECDRHTIDLMNSWVHDINESKKLTGKLPVTYITNLPSINSWYPFAVHSILIVYDANDQVIFPKFENNTIAQNDIYSENLSEIWTIEFVSEDFNAAAKLYGNLAEKTKDENLKCKAIISKARCLIKAKDYSNAIEQCEYLFSAFHSNPEEPNTFTLSPDTLINNYLMLLDLYIKTGLDYDNLVNDLLMLIQNPDHPLAIREFGLKKLEAYTNNGTKIIKESNSPLYNQVFKKIKAQRQSLNIAEKYPNISMFGEWKPNTIQRIKFQEPIYGFFFEDNLRKYVVVGVPSILSLYKNNFEDKSIICKFKDNYDDYLNGFNEQIPDTNPILSVPMGNSFPDFTVELYMKNANIFDDTASKRIFAYIWVGVLVIGLILISGTIAGSTISKQMKMNKLKNDFIATVTHELKTPLASMRVLADTLLEGNYTDKKQEKEYLELICKENKRLTGLIDDFLTFSRMERNKQVFEFKQVSPTDIVKSAIEALQTKYNQNNCAFSVSIDNDLPSISADKDAIVTVLINLLDNAYKYTYDKKEIALKVFREGQNVCFSVKDNGIGMTKRQIRKIFDRFYQADTTLSRRAEGTGLGLSIVKFILDAHNATIEVKSHPEIGSTFIVKIQAVK